MNLLLDRRPMSQWSTEAFLSLNFLLWPWAQTQTNLIHLAAAHQFQVKEGEKLLLECATKSTVNPQNSLLTSSNVMLLLYE